MKVYLFKFKSAKSLNTNRKVGSVFCCDKCMILFNAHRTATLFTCLTEMGHKTWGTLYFGAKNIITYSLSPYEQKAFHGLFSKGIPNIIRRFTDEIFYILPGIGTGGLVYYYGTKDFKRRQRKNPADYAHEQ